MNILAFIGAGLIGAVLSVVIKQYKPEFSIYISLITGMLMLGAAVLAISPAISTLLELVNISGVKSQYVEILVKALAVCYITQLASDSCADAGEKSIGSKIEFAGKCAIVLISLPLFNELTEIVIGFMS